MHYLVLLFVFLSFSCVHQKRFSNSFTMTPSLVSAPGVDELKLATQYAPIFYQERKSKSDHFTRIDFDGDWIADNNWDNLEHFEPEAAGYYEVFSTSTHHFIMYAIFHPRDDSWFCLPVVCHENDMEGVLVVVDRKTLKWIYAESVAHNFIQTTKNHSNSERPEIVIEWGGHGLYPKDQYKAKHPLVVYDDVSLIPIAEIWNKQFESNRLFGDTFNYMGARYSMRSAPKSFLGRKWSKNSANPPWAWVDLQRGSRGDLFFDPANYIRKKHNISVSLDYERHPYLTKTAPPD